MEDTHRGDEAAERLQGVGSKALDMLTQHCIECADDKESILQNRRCNSEHRERLRICRAREDSSLLNEQKENPRLLATES